jgi:hypothetical protein
MIGAALPIGQYVEGSHTIPAVMPVALQYVPPIHASQMPISAEWHTAAFGHAIMPALPTGQKLPAWHVKCWDETAAIGQ